MHMNIYKVSVSVHIYTWHATSGRKPAELDRPDNTGYGMPTYVHNYGENLNIPARMEDHNPRETVEHFEPTQGGNPGADSGHAYL